jgi:ferredoxin
MDNQTKDRYIVKVIPEKCISAGTCIAVAALTFRFNNKKIAEVISQDGDTDEDKLLGAQSCPTNAIEVIEKATGKKVWPIDEN